MREIWHRLRYHTWSRVRARWATLSAERRRASYWAERYFGLTRRLSRYELALEEMQEQLDSYEIELAVQGRRIERHDEDLDEAEIAWSALTGRIELLEGEFDRRLEGEDVFGYVSRDVVSDDDVAQANGAVLDQLRIEEERAAA